MIVWMLRDGDHYRGALGDRVPVGAIDSYAAVCAHHVSDFTEEEEARREAEAIHRAGGGRWGPTPVDFADAVAEDFEEHFEAA